MRIKLWKACRDFNVEISAVIKELENNGIFLDEANPNTRISGEEYELIAKAFSRETRLLALTWQEDKFGLDPISNREEVNSHGWDRLRNDIIIAMPTRYILIPKDQSCDSFSFWTRENIATNCPMAVVDGKVVREKLKDPTGTIPVLPYIPDDKVQPLREKPQEVFRLPNQPNSSKVTVVGSIDLSSLNATTRPKRKTKEERKQERLARKSTSQPQKQRVAQDLSTNAIRDIWQHFVDIQEKLIKQRCSPISIDPTSVKIENDKIYVTIDESQDKEKINSILKDKLGVESYNLESGSILVDENKWDALSETDLSEIRRCLSECHIELDTTPTINVTIDYANDMGHYDQLSLDDLRQLDSILKNGNLIQGQIDDIVAFISKVSVNSEDYLRYLFGNHYVIYEKKRKKQDSPQIIETFEYRNEYITSETLRQYENIGLYCKQYTLIFKICNEVAKEELKYHFDCFYPTTETFEFKRTFTKGKPSKDNYIQEVNANIKAFLNVATLYCSQDDIEINVLFSYAISKQKLVKTKLQEVAYYINGLDGYSFNEEAGAIGIDFNWREQNIADIIANIENNIPFIKINVYDNHRYKCKVDSKLIGYDDLKAYLEEKYEDISVINDSVCHQIKIRLPYIEPDLYELLSARLNNDLLHISIPGIKIEFAQKVAGKIRLNISCNSESRLEDLEDSIMDMRRADFGFTLGEKEIPFGKLLKVNYPNLIFDLDVPDDRKDAIIEVFESQIITRICPILTGEIEKISRLKNTFTMATTGQELTNPRLQNFIFDSSKATKTPDIELMLREDGPVYIEFCAHLLNNRINESQKQAIIKAMYAEDMAVIQGPPGTGKSTAIAELIWQLIRKGLQYGNKRERILLTSETNLAVDNAISRIVNGKTNLVKPVRLGGEEKLESEGLQFSLELMKRWVEEGDACLTTEETNDESEASIKNNLILKNWLENISHRAFYGVVDDSVDVIVKWRNFLNNPSKGLREIVYQRYVENANVVGATCSSIGDRRAGEADFNGFTPFFHNYCDLFKQKKGKARIEFTTVIQDESSKATPAELVLPFVYGKRAIVIGDHRQLPPMLDKEEFEDTFDYAYRTSKDSDDQRRIMQLKEFVESHFDEMEISHFQKLYERIDSSLKGTFNLQYRMHPDINEVVEQFYREDGGLRCGLISPEDLGVNDPDISNPASRYHGIDIQGLIDHNTHVLFINTTSPEMLDGTSRVNYGEVEIIDRLLTKFEQSSSFLSYLNQFSKDEDKQIGIISFYGKQIKQLRSIAREHSSLPIRVSTVDRFQGMERNIVIVSMVRSNIIQSSRNQQPDKKRYPELGYPKQTSLGFAQSPNRLNVALSRAKRLLVIVGNKELFSNLEIYQRLFLTIESNHNNKVINQNEL